MTAADQAAAADIAAALTPRMVEVLREAAAGHLFRERRSATAYVLGWSPAVTQTARSLARRDLVITPGLGVAAQSGGDPTYEVTELGGAVLARLAGQDGAR